MPPDQTPQPAFAAYDLPDAQGALAEHVARGMDQRLAEGAVGNDQDPDHAARPAWRSSASMNMVATSKPV